MKRSGSSTTSLTDMGVPAASAEDKLNIFESGEEGTLDYRLRFAMAEHAHSQQVISVWHDIPLYVRDEAEKCTGHLNFVCEIPRCSRKKFEIATNEVGNPIKQDTKKGLLREFKKGDIFFNYGCFPRTWEDPEHVHPDTKFPGDNDPLDVCEIGLRIVATGDVRQVKVLGVLAMIDEDETDWKVIVIDREDRWAPELNDVEDVERLLPGVVSAIREWFRTYKVPDGKPENKFALDERCMGRSYAMKVVSECHLAWRNLVGKAELGEVKSNLSVSRLSDMGSDIELESATNALEVEADGGGDGGGGGGAGDDDEEGEYPTSLIA
ncbi:unnamed protein product [Ectocarpus sp. 6 AP-2014]